MRTPTSTNLPLVNDIWADVLEHLASDPICLAMAGEEPRGLRALALCCLELYWVTRPYLWRSVRLADIELLNDFIEIASTANPDTPEGVSLGSYVLKLSVEFASIPSSSSLHRMILLLPNLTSLSLELIPPTYQGQRPLPDAIFMALNECFTPLRRLILRGGRACPTVNHLNTLTYRVGLERLQITGIHAGQAGNPVFPNPAPGWRPNTVSHLELYPPAKTASTLADLPPLWNVDKIEALTVNEYVNLVPWLNKFGSNLQTLRLPADHEGIAHPRSILGDLCPNLKELTVVCPSTSSMVRAELPRSLMVFRVVCQESRGPGGAARNARAVQSYLNDFSVEDLPNLEFLEIEALDTDGGLDRSWVGRFTKRLQASTVEMRIVPLSRHGGI